MAGPWSGPGPRKWPSSRWSRCGAFTKFAPTARNSDLSAAASSRHPEDNCAIIIDPSSRSRTMAIEPLAIGVCSWSLQVKTIPELKKLVGRLGVDVVQIACGDPHHAAWEEGDKLPEVAKTSGLRL